MKTQMKLKKPKKKKIDLDKLLNIKYKKTSRQVIFEQLKNKIHILPPIALIPLQAGGKLWIKQTEDIEKIHL